MEEEDIPDFETITKDARIVGFCGEINKSHMLGNCDSLVTTGEPLWERHQQ